MSSGNTISDIIPTIVEFMLVMMIMKMMMGTMSGMASQPEKADTSFKDIKGPYSAGQYVGGKVNSAGDIIDSTGNVVGHATNAAMNYAYKGGQYLGKGINKVSKFLNS
jgi:hypothetical protein